VTKSILSRPIVAAPLAIFCTILWGSAYPFIKLGYELFQVGVDDTAAKLSFAGQRFLLAGILVLLFRRLSSSPSKKESYQTMTSLSSLQWFRILILALTQTAVHYYFFYVGLSYTTGAKSAIVNAVTVFFSALLAHFFYANDRITVKKGIGILIGFSAVILVNLEPEVGFSFILRGEGFIAIAAILNSIAALYSKKSSRTIDPVLLTGTQLSIGGALLLVSGFVLGGSFPVSNLAGYGVLFYLALLSSLAFSIWAGLLKHNKVSSITVFNFLVPVVGVFLSALILHEAVFKLEYAIALGAVVIGIYLVNSSRSST
jgi:drug/metabolite transporter (DMT)-like permease